MSTVTKTRINKLLNNLAKDFDISTLSKSPARFNQKKLDWFNKIYLKMLSLPEFIIRLSQNQKAKANLDNLSLQISEVATKLDQKSELNTSEAKFCLALYLDKNRINKLSEAGLDSSCVLAYKPPDPELLKWRKISLEESLQNLRQLLPEIESIYENQRIADLQFNLLSSIQEQDLPEKFDNLVTIWDESIKKLFDRKNVGNYLWPLRVSLSGKAKSPSPFELLTVLDFTEAKRRIQVSEK